MFRIQYANPTLARRQRGVILVLVVALCTILALLGSTYLLISRADRKRNENISTVGVADTAIQQTIGNIRSALAEDLHISSSGSPYTDMDSGNKKFLQYIDIGAEFDFGDAHLGTVLDRSSGSASSTVTHVTNLTTTTESDRYINRNANILADVDGMAYDPTKTTNYGRNEALAYDLKLNDANGRSFFAAVNLMDTSGLININSIGPGKSLCMGLSGKTETELTFNYMPLTISPAMIPIASFFDNEINWENGGTPPSDPAGQMPFTNYIFTDLTEGTKPWLYDITIPSDNYLMDCAIRNQSPDTTVTTPIDYQYKPYSLAEEIFFRRPKTTHGRGYDTFSTAYNTIGGFSTNAPLWSEPIHLFTTYNSSRPLTRTGSTKTKMVTANAAGVHLKDMSSSANKQDLFTNIYALLLLQWNTPTAAKQEKAAQQAMHFVANYWAFTDMAKTQQADTEASKYSAALSKAYKVSTDELTTGLATSYTAYGYVPSLVITDAYGYVGPNLDDGSGTEVDGIRIWAVEITAPWREVELDNFYAVGNGGTETDLKTVVGSSVSKNQKYILYNYDNGYITDAATGTVKQATNDDVLDILNDGKEDNNTIPGTETWKYKKCDSVNFNNSGRVGIFRVVNDGLANNEYIPVDTVKHDNLGYDGSTISLGGTAKIFWGLRDDVAARSRFMIPAYLKKQQGPSTFATYFAAENGVSYDDLTGTKYPLPHVFPWDLGDADDLGTWDTYSMGAMEYIYILGPQSDSTTGTTASDAISDTNSFGEVYADWVTGVSQSPHRFRISFLENMPSDGSYPKLPLGCLLSEFLEFCPTDPTDSDRILGKININTISQEALTDLLSTKLFSYVGSQKVTDFTVLDISPGAALTNHTISSVTLRASEIAAAICTYRDLNTFADVDMAGTNPYVSSYGISDLRNNCWAMQKGTWNTVTDPNVFFNGYMSTNEVAIPVLNYIASKLEGYYDEDGDGTNEWASISSAADLADENKGCYLTEESWLKISRILGRILNLFTVNSDTYVANITIYSVEPTSRGEGYLGLYPDSDGNMDAVTLVDRSGTPWAEDTWKGGTLILTSDTWPADTEYSDHDNDLEKSIQDRSSPSDYGHAKGCAFEITGNTTESIKESGGAYKRVGQLQLKDFHETDSNHITWSNLKTYMNMPSTSSPPATLNTTETEDVVAVKYAIATKKWNYIVFFDRSNCTTSADQPRVLFMAEIP